MRFLCSVLLLGSVLLPLARADIGLDDPYEKVIAEKGEPTGRAESGDSMILRYPDGTIRLKGGKVVAMNMKPVLDEGPSRPPARATTTAVTTKPRATASSATPPVATAQPAAAPLAWHTNFRGAMAEAKAQHRRVFVLFTGSDWCVWCQRLNAEILSTPAFARYANEALVLVEVDFPSHKPQSRELHNQNAMLQQIFQVSGYPTVVVLDPDGSAVGRLGYQEGGPGPFLEALKAL